MHGRRPGLDLCSRLTQILALSTRLGEAPGERISALAAGVVKREMLGTGSFQLARQFLTHLRMRAVVQHGPVAVSVSALPTKS